MENRPRTETEKSVDIRTPYGLSLAMQDGIVQLSY